MKWGIVLGVLLYFFQAQAQSQIDAPASISLHTLTDDQKAAIEKLGQKSIPAQIEEIKKEVPLELISTERKGGAHYFDSLGPATRSIDQITDIEGLYGKAVCGKAKILIADDAPPTTLLHEYIHFLQMSDEKRWCELDGRLLEPAEKKERAIFYHRFEFEVLKTLWDLRDKIPMNFEDKLIIIEGLNRENTVFKNLGVKALEDSDASVIDAGLEEMHGQIQTMTWLTRKREDAGAVLNKMEVISLKSCVEQSSGDNLLKKTNACLIKRCGLTSLKCKPLTQGEAEKAGDDVLSKVLMAWLRPLQKDDCALSKFKDEMGENIEAPTACWKKWFGSHQKSAKTLKLKSAGVKKFLRDFKAPDLPIDAKISFYEPPNPEAFINTAYCYFIFEKVARFETLPIDQFPFAALGASLSLSKISEYNTWLESTNSGKSCGTLVKIFSGEEPSDLSDLEGGGKNILIINSIAALTGGLETFKKALATDVNHERLHIIFSNDKRIQKKIKSEWLNLSEDEKEKFKKDHSSYDFNDEKILLKEYFSYSRQDHPKKLF